MSAPPGRFARHLAGLDLTAHDVTADAVERALQAPSLQTLPALLSPAAAPRLEQLARQARAVTLQRFGRAVRLFAPLYVSNACLSS